MHIARCLTVENVSRKFALLAVLALAPTLLLAQAPSSTLDHVRSTGTLTLGYFPAARPLSYKNASGNADGYAVALCRGIAAVVKGELGLPDLSVQFVPVGADAVAAVQTGRIDLLCAPVEPTLSRRANVSFSIPAFAGGTGVLMRKDASKDFRELLEGRTTGYKPLWRGQPQLQAINQRKFVVIAGSMAERRVKTRKQELGVNSVISTVPNLQAGLQKVSSGEADAFLADRSVLLDLARNDPSVIVVDRVFDHTMLSLAMRRGDEDFRLLVDKTLSRLYRTGKINGIYEKHLGKPNAATREWFRQVAEAE